MSPSLTTVADLGERALIDRIKAQVPPAPRWVTVAIGDDAAVIEPSRGELTVVTTDALVEGVHFNRSWTPASDIGHKALAVNLSDLAAMGSTPRHALLSLAIPAPCLVTDVDALVGALLALAAHHRTTLVGGNIAASTGPLFISVTATGSVKRRRVLTRAGAKPGDALYVSGTIGGAAAGLASLQRQDTVGNGEFSSCRQRHLRPEPRVILGIALGRNRAAHACVDLSDGLADGVHQLATASHVGVQLEADTIPIDPKARAWFEQTGFDPLTAALTGGEDYELLFAIPAEFRGRLTHVKQLIGDLPLTRIGVVTKDRQVVLRRDGTNEPLPNSYQHFEM